MSRHSIWKDGSTERGRLQGTLPAPGGASSRAHTVAAERKCQAYRAVLEAEQQELIASAPAPSSTATYGSHMRFFVEFCEQTGIDPEKFASNPHPSTEELQEEDGVLIAFKQHASRAPRKPGKKKLAGTRNGRSTVGYASSCMSTARLFYERRVQRTVGLCGPKGRSSTRMLEVTKALAKRQPEPQPPRPPILAEHMLAMRGQCDLEGSDTDVLMWAIANTCWADIKRLGDLLSSPEEAARGWNPDSRLHRDRITIVANRKGGHDIIINHKPPKADPTGMYRHESCLSTGPASELLNPANALKRLFLRDGDPKGTDMAQQPVFRDPATRKEIAKIDFRRWMSKKFEAAGLRQFVGKAHSLRIGGATTLFELEGAEAVKALGGWASEVFRHYVHLTREQRSAYVRRMGQQSASGTVPHRNLPIGRVR